MTGVAVIGTGSWGRNHVRVYKELMLEGEIATLKICDSDAHRLKGLEATFGLEGVTDYRRLLADAGIQAVSIATPSGTHYQLGREFMEAGKDVLVEKPMTMNSEEARKLMDIANSCGRILMVGHIFRYHPAVVELKRRLDVGELGDIQSLFSQRSYFGLPRSDMGVVYALGIHELDMFCYLLNRRFPQSLLTVTNCTFQSHIEETAMLVMDFGEVKGYALESWLLPAYGKRRELVVVGSEKTASVDYMNSQELVIYDAKIYVSDSKPVRVEDEGKRIIPLPFAEPLKQEIRHFLSCVKSRARPLTDAVSGYNAVVMAEAALKSARSGQPIKFSQKGNPIDV